MRAHDSSVVTGAQPIESRRPLWLEVGLSALFSVALVLFGWAASFVGDVITKSDQGVWTFLALVYVIVVAFLVYYAYPPGRRRIYAAAGFEICVVVPGAVLIPLVYLPWLIVTRKARPATEVR